MAGFFGLFNYTKEGPGVSKEEAQKKGLELYFDILIRRFWKFMALNTLYILSSVISLAVLWFISSMSITWLFSIMGVDMAAITSEESGAMFMFAVCAVIVIAGVLGTGAPTAAASYVMRNYVNDSHSWVVSDYFEHLKKNFLQGTIVFIVDVIVLCLFLVSMVFYSVEVSGIFPLILRSILLVAFVIFAMMHMYIYQIMAKFKMKLSEIYRSSLILVLIKLPWNILAFIVSGLITYIVGYVFNANFVIAIAVSVLMYFSLNLFTQIFMTNNIVKKYILEPSLEYEKKQEENTSEDK